MYKTYFGFALITFYGLFVQPVFAAAYVPCDGCSYTQMQGAALGRGVGRYVIGNINANKVEAYRVYFGTHANSVLVNNVMGRLYIEDGSLTAQEEAAFSAYVKFYNAPPMGYQKQFDLRIVPAGSPVGVPNSVATVDIVNASPASAMGLLHNISPTSVPKPGGGTVSYPTPGVNAYTVLNDGPSQNAFLGWLGGLAMFNISDTLTTAATALSVLHVTNVDHVLSISFTVTFTDGSHIGAYVDATQLPAQIVVNPKTAVDSHGNNIPAAVAAVTGNGSQNYNFSGRGNATDRGNMRNQIGRFGIDLPNTEKFACTSISGGSIHCVPY
jgi:hypothetical protein